jgi:hypothetical protein
MKKLLFATAIAASAAAFANPINAVGFENYDVNDTFENGGDENNEVGGTDKYFCFDGESNSSVVTNASPSTMRTAYFGSLKPTPPANANYLALDTEGGTFWRSINTIINSGETYSLGEARAVAATGTYLDTLVQFTVTEDEAPTVGEDDKLAIWLQAGEGTTNLMVRAAVIDDEFNLTPTEFTITNASVTAGAWYRLTVKAIADVTEADGVPAFQVYLDGALLKGNVRSLTDEYLDLIDSDYKSAIQEGSVFVSLLGVNSTTLQGVGFQGTGAVDEIVWTEEDPFPAAVVEFTLTFSGDANTTLGAVTYTIGEDPAQTVTSGDKVPEGATVTIAQPTFTQGYQLAALTIGGTAVADPEFPYSFTMTADTTVAITSVLPVLNPTVDGTPVEPANVFNTAITTKPIVYPTEPTLAGTAGVDQTITFNGVTVNVPTYYDAKLAGTTVSLSLNTNAIPAIGEATVESEEKAAIEVGATTFTTTLTTTNTKLYYGLKTATTPNAAEWTVGTLTQGTGAAMQIQADKPTVSGDTASAGFFKLYVTDVAPVTP